MGKGNLRSNLLLIIGTLVVILMICALNGMIPGQNGTNREAETKSNLHNIQLSLERYAVDHDGTYPQYLIGGEARWADTVDLESAKDAFRGIRDCDLALVGDPLLREGYHDVYPRNPFVRDGREIHRNQVEVALSNMDGDPLRNGHEQGEILGTRFGPYCTSMGQVLCDARWEFLSRLSPTTGEPETWYTGSAVEYRMWNQFAGKKPKTTYMPGMFFYKGMGPIMAVGDAGLDDKARGLPTEIDQYMLGVYGGLKTRGMDVFGQSAQWNFAARSQDSAEATAQESSCSVWSVTHSEIAGTKGAGDPYTPGRIGDSCRHYKPGNPNGIHDGIILVLP